MVNVHIDEHDLKSIRQLLWFMTLFCIMIGDALNARAILDVLLEPNLQYRDNRVRIHQELCVNCITVTITVEQNIDSKQEI